MIIIKPDLLIENYIIAIAIIVDYLEKSQILIESGDFSICPLQRIQIEPVVRV